MARARALSHPHACLKRCPVLVRGVCHSRTVEDHIQCLRRVLGRLRLGSLTVRDGCNAIDRPPVAGPPRRARAVRLCLLGSVSASAVYLFHLRPDTHSRLSVPSTSPAPSRLCGHIVKSLSMMTN